MKNPILRVGLIVGTVVCSQVGCHQAEKAKTVTSADLAKPDDPTAWTDKDVKRGSSDSGAGDSGLPKGSALKGSWSSEGQDIERSLGIGK